jgi:AcrR family transcriptional regulator
MPRSGKESRARLQQAALELFDERGFDTVTTAEIAERAGVTERTYFRHFPDKREVLFAGEDQLAAWMTAALADVPDRVPPLRALQEAFLAITPMLESNRPASERLTRIIAATPALWERAAAKEGRLVELYAQLLRARGVPDDDADLAARTSSALSAHAMRSWRLDPTIGLRAHVERAITHLRDLTGA